MVSGDISMAMDPALGIEIFHNFTLLHDDIMDNAPIRRGKETVYKKWNTSVAILSGDTMMALSYEYIMKSPEKVRSKVFSVFNKTAIEVCEGQQFDMNFENQANVSIEDYLEMIRLKTAVLLAASLQIGSMIGNGDENTNHELYNFGENIGIAFQLKDDLLDVFSDATKFGKTSGGDIIANKKTFLYLKAFEMADEETTRALEQLFGDKSLSDEKKVLEVKKIYNKLDIKSLTEERIEFYYKRAKKSLAAINVPEEKKKELIAFANLLKVRDY
jgi:geranylgeranyl diphosphate synthase type II